MTASDLTVQGTSQGRSYTELLGAMNELLAVLTTDGDQEAYQRVPVPVPRLETPPGGVAQPSLAESRRHPGGWCSGQAHGL